MRAIRHGVGILVGIGIAITLALLLWGLTRQRPQDVPWAPLDLGQPVGMSTGRKLTALTQKPDQCMALLDRAGIRYNRLPARRDGEQCGYDDAVRFTSGGARVIDYRLPRWGYPARSRPRSLYGNGMGYKLPRATCWVRRSCRSII
ncbi:Uncharacterised protein [Sphingomonas paucimobilis]|nr:Uncharacterised protein [Sphingomonas paucimobilis]